MKALPVLTTSFALAAALTAPAANLMLDFGNPTANTSVAETSTSASPGPVATGSYLTLSPGHAANDVPSTETTWNTITAAHPTASPNTSLSYSDGTSASGVTLVLGQEATAGNNTISYATAVASLNLIGNGGGTAGQQRMLTAGSIYGDTRLGSSAVGRDGFFGGTGSAMGFRLDGLAAGDYLVYLMGRNTNSNDTVLRGMAFYATTGTASDTFDNFHTAPTQFQTNATYASTGYANQYGSFVAGENYVAFNVSLTEGQSLFVAVDGTQSEARGFLNMAQIVAVPEPAAAMLGAIGMLALLRRRRD